MPDTDPARDWRALLIDRLAGLAVAGLAVVLYALGADDGVWIVVLFGGLALVGVIPPQRKERGFARVSAIVPIAAAGVASLVLLALVTMLGCAGIERSGEVLELRYKPDPKRPPPACLYVMTLDGEVIQRGTVDDCRVPHG